MNVEQLLGTLDHEIIELLNILDPLQTSFEFDKILLLNNNKPISSPPKEYDVVDPMVM